MELNKIICGNVLEVLKTFPDESVDCIITSPPYYHKRVYGSEAVAIWGGDPNCGHEWDQNGFCKKCGAWKGELGLEPSPSLYVEHLLQITAELKRVLKKTGTFFLNINDTFSQISGNGMRQKSMALIPERLLIGLYDQGWYVRNKIIWVKSNALPESVKDRLANRYEHVFFLTKNKRYYFDLDSIRISSATMRSKTNSTAKEKVIKHDIAVGRVGNFSYSDPLHTKAYHPLGKNPGDILETTTEPFGKEFCPKCKRFLEKEEAKMVNGTLVCGHCGTPVVSHFAVFPKKLVTPLITAGCPPGGIVLDPFCGSGTALIVAKELGRKYIGIDAVRAYCDMAEARLKETKVVVKLTSF